MTRTFDQTDVPFVNAREMATALRAVVEAERARVFFEGVDDCDRGKIEGAFWKIFDGEAAQGGIILLRLWCLIDALQSRRLKARLFDRGFDFLNSAVAAAADLRLNLDWGFAPQKLIWGIDRAEALQRTHQPLRVDFGVARHQQAEADMAA
jgi:hypothetical protein